MSGRRKGSGIAVWHVVIGHGAPVVGAQLNVKLRPETRDEIYAIADANLWGVG